MRKHRSFVAALVLAAALTTAGPATSALASTETQTSSASAPSRQTELAGICGTLVGGGLTLASLGKTVVARGAGWVGAIVSAGCLLHDANEYSDAYSLTPEGRAEIDKIIRTYRNHTFEDFMAEFDCEYVEKIDTSDSPSYGTRSGYWNCRTGRD